MVELNLKVRNDLFEKIGTVCSRCYCAINGSDELLVSGRISLLDDSEASVSYIDVQADICDKDDRILYVFEGDKKLSLGKVGEVSFLIKSKEISNNVEMGNVSYVEISPM